MSELTTGQLIKIILGLLVVIAVVVGAGFYFKDSVISFFSGLSEDNPENESAQGGIDLSGYQGDTSRIEKIEITKEISQEESNNKTEGGDIIEFPKSNSMEENGEDFSDAVVQLVPIRI